MQVSPPRRAPVSDEPSAGVTLALGLLAGIVLAVAFTSWEWAVVRWLGLDLPTGTDRDRVLLVHALLAGGLGALFGGLRLRGGGWALAMAGALAGWLLSGKLGIFFAQVGLPPHLGLLLPAVGLVGGLIVARMPMEDGRKLGLATTVFVALTLGLPLNLHLLPAPFAPLALIVDTGVGLLAIATGLIVSLFVGSRAQPGVLPPVVLAAGLGLAGFYGADQLERGHDLPPRGEARPIVLIVVDTLRADHLGTYGYSAPTSPAIDALARRSLVYDNARSHASWTLPSMGSLWTGRYPSTHGAGVNTGLSNRLSGLRRDLPSLPAALSDAGYVTIGLSTNPWTSASFGFQRGFHVYDDRVGAYALPVAVHPLRVMGIEPLTAPEFRPAEQMVDAAIDTLDQLGDRGWFLSLHLMDVHGPHRPRQQDLDALSDAGLRGYTARYDAAIHQVDRQIARLLEHIPDNAVVILTADHGEELDEDRTPPEGVPVGARHGHTLYEEVLHIPLIVRVPGGSGRRIARPVGLADVFPTVLTLVDAPLPARLDGEPLVEIVGGQSTPDRLIVSEAMRWGREQQAARMGPYKFIRRHERGYELYDLQAHPFEQVQMPVVDEQSELLVRTFRAGLHPVGAVIDDEPVQLGADVRSLLERLGYTDPR